jgi:hypothetical protein
MEVHRGLRQRGSHIFTDGSEAVNLTCQPPTLYPQEDQWHSFVRRWVDSRAKMQLERLWELKSNVTFGTARNLFCCPCVSGLENRECGCRDPSCWPHGTFYPQKLALPSLTSGSRSVGIGRSRTQATEFSFSPYVYYVCLQVHSHFIIACLSGLTFFFYFMYHYIWAWIAQSV